MLAESAMDVGAYMIGMVKTNTKWLYKETIENITKDFPGGSYLVLRRKPMVLGVRPLIDIGYRYNARKVICFIVTEDSGSKKVGIPYLFKYPDQFFNVTTFSWSK